MWQLWAVSSLLATVIEGVADKRAFVRSPHVHFAVATFWRHAFVLGAVLAVGLSGLAGDINFFFTWQMLGYGCLVALGGYGYTYILRRLEVSGAFIELYLSPVAFLAIDIFILELSLTPAQIAGVLLLSCGGFALALGARTHRLRREFTMRIWGVFLFWLVLDAVKLYLFKHLHTVYALNEVSFFASALVIACTLLFAGVFYTRSVRLLFHRDTLRYMPTAMVAKVLAAVATLLWLHALTSAAVSQVTAMYAIQPLILIAVVWLVQKETTFDIREHIDRASLRWKLGAVLLLCLGLFAIA